MPEPLRPNASARRAAPSPNPEGEPSRQRLRATYEIAPRTLPVERDAIQAANNHIPGPIRRTPGSLAPLRLPSPPRGPLRWHAEAPPEATMVETGRVAGHTRAPSITIHEAAPLFGSVETPALTITVPSQVVGRPRTPSITLTDHESGEVTPLDTDNEAGSRTMQESFPLFREGGASDLPTLEPRVRLTNFEASEVLAAFNPGWNDLALATVRRARPTDANMLNPWLPAFFQRSISPSPPPLGESRNTENVEKTPRRVRTAKIIDHVRSKFALPADPKPQLDELANLLACARLADCIFPGGELTGLDLYEVVQERTQTGRAWLDSPALTACLRLAKVEMDKCDKDDLGGRFEVMVNVLESYAHSDACSPEMMEDVKEPARAKRYGFMYENAFAALDKLRKNDTVSLYDNSYVSLGSLAALTWNRIMAAPRGRRLEELNYLTWLLDECVEATGKVVCGNGCTQRMAAILHHLECQDAPHILSLEMETSDEQVTFSAKLFYEAWKKAAETSKPLGNGDMQDFYNGAVRAFRSQPHGDDEFRNFEFLLRKFFDMTYEFSPLSPP